MKQKTPGGATGDGICTEVLAQARGVPAGVDSVSVRGFIGGLHLGRPRSIETLINGAGHSRRWPVSIYLVRGAKP